MCAVIKTDGELIAKPHTGDQFSIMDHDRLY